MKQCIQVFILTIFVFQLFSCKKEEDQIFEIERGSVTDADGNVYMTVKIGDQWWMAENLRVSVFNDSTPLQHIPMTTGSDTTWSSSSSPAFCYINDSISGYLYNSLVLSSDKSIAPDGWRIPSDEDWRKLEAFIGMTSDELEHTGWRGISEADFLVSKFNNGWPANDQINGLYGSDTFGFNALPGGCRGVDGRTNTQNNTAFWWTSTQSDSLYYYRYIDAMKKQIFRQTMQGGYGLSIRCIKSN